jgi:hypothetical protein
LSFGIVNPSRELEDLPAFLTFSQKQWNWHLRGVKELGRPLLISMWQNFQNLWRRMAHLKMRELHA